MYGMTTFTKSYHHVMLDKDPRMTKPMKEVYCFLLSFQETESISQIFPSTQKIAEFTCNSDRTVKRATKALQDIGLIQKTRRFNSSSIFKVMPYATKDAGATQSLTIGPHSPQPGATVSSYKITDKIKDKISLQEEGQNQYASLSQVNMGLDETRIHCDKSVSDLNLDEEIAEEKSVKREELVTHTYASMPSDSFEDEDELTDFNNDSMVLRSEDYITANFEDEPDLTDKDDESTTSPVGLYNDLKTPEQSYRDLLHKSANRITALNKKPKQFNRSQSYRSNSNY